MVNYHCILIMINIMSKIRNFFRVFFIYCSYFIYKLYGMNISRTARISFGAKLDKTNPKGIYIGANSYVASGSIIFTHDYSRSLYLNTYIGENCFIGANSIIMPGVTIGDNVIIGCSSVVTKNVPSNSIAVGNPAKVIKTGIKTTKFGKML